MKSSEYAASYTGVDSLFGEYYERLNFRLTKRNSEYAHHPFAWDAVLAPGQSPVTHNPMNTRGLLQISGDKGINADMAEEEPPGISAGDTKLTDVGSVQEPACPPLMGVKESSTQTQTASFIPERRAHRKTFGPYGIGSTDGSTFKRTFNVKSESDIYPSATRADVLRRERLTNEHLRAGQTDTKHNQGFSSSSYVPKPIPSKYNLPTSYQIKHGHDTKRSCTGNNGDVWQSEYNRQFPIYPTSVYARSASTAAGRCRPLSGRYSSRKQPSLVPNHPVLLSSRGSDSVMRSNLPDTCSCNGQYMPRILSAR